MTRLYSGLIYLFLVAAILINSSAAQAPVATGVQPFGSFSGGPDIVNVGDLNVHVSIPLIHKAGRGIPFDYLLSFDSTVWSNVSPSAGLQAWVPSDAGHMYGWSAQGPGGSSSSLVFSSFVESNCYIQINTGTPAGTIWAPAGIEYYNYVYLDSLGNAHPFSTGQVYYNGPATVTGPYTTNDCGKQTVQGFPATALDGSGIQLLCNNCVPGTTTGFTVQLPNGQTITGSSLANTTNIQDTNGNYLTTSGTLFGGVQDGSYPIWTDTLGQTVVATTDTTTSGSYAGGNYADVAAAIAFTGGDGNVHSYVVSHPAEQITTAFGCPGVTEYTSISVQDLTLADHLMTSVALPDGTSYSFGYEPTTPGASSFTGRIASITYPHGGSVSYRYGPINCSDGSPLSLTRIVNDGVGHSYTWNYQRTYLSATSQWQTIVTDPQKNQTVYVFVTGRPPTEQYITEGVAVADDGVPYAGPSTNFYEVSKTVYLGVASSGSILQKTVTCYSGNTTSEYNPGCSTPAPFPYPITSRQVTVAPNGGSVISGAVVLYNSLGLVTSTSSYDFGGSNGQVGSLLINTATSYAPLGGILGKPSSVVQTDGAGNVLSSISYSYDQNAVVTTSGTPHLAAVTGSRGNVTTISTQAGSETFPTKYTYYDTGLVDTATDVNGVAVTTNTYGACGNSFLTGTFQSGGNVPLATYAFWSCTGGVQTATTDVNGNTATINSYDMFWRPTSSTDALGNVTTATYPTLSSNTSETSTPFNGGASVSDTLVTYDGLGRPILSQKRQAPGSTTFASISVGYDLWGNANWKSLPYSGRAGAYISSGSGTTRTYDPLGRVQSVQDSGGGVLSYGYNVNDTTITQGPAATGENAKVRQMQINGLGQLTSVCEVTSMPGSSSCGQNTAATGYLTQYTYDGGRLTNVSQNVQAGAQSTQNRAISYDGFGRKLTEVIPETGTSRYTYDSDSSGACPGQSAGDLIKKMDNLGNVTCYTYDSLHRPLTSQVVSGVYTGLTPSVGYVYDAAILSNIGMLNVKGTLAEAFTCSGSCSPKPAGLLTDAYFSSTPEVVGGNKTGRLTSEMWEATSHSYGYFLTQTTSYPNGQAGATSAILQNGPVQFTNIGVPSIAYGVDGMGRPVSATDTTNSRALVSTTSYSALGGPSSVTLGNGDSDSFGYDPATGRPTSFGYAIGGSSPFNIHGSLTWNPNSSLQNFTLTDSSDSTKNQNCGYSMDDLNRLASVNCSGSWAQNFHYDAFGNISKGGPTNPAPGQITSSYSALYGLNGYGSLTNQVTGGTIAAYDGNGNQTMTTSNQLSWNAAAQPVVVNGIGATYDAAGRLVETGDTVAGVPGTVSTGSIAITGQEKVTAPLLYTATATISFSGQEQGTDAGGGAVVVVTVPTSGGPATQQEYEWSYSPGTTLASIWSQLSDAGLSGTATLSANGLTETIVLTVSSSSPAPVFFVVSGGSGCSGQYHPCSFTQTTPNGEIPGVAYGGSGSVAHDTGTVSATITGLGTNYTASYSWGQNDTPFTIATALAASINQAATNPSGLKALTATVASSSPTDSTITLTSTQTGPAYNWPVSTTVTDTSGGAFTASFAADATSMSGGVGVPGATGNGTYTQYVYSPGGAKIATVQNGALVQAVVPLPGGESAVYNSSGFGWFRHKDWLGSSRLATTWAHTVYAKEAYAPFGETYNEAGTPDRSFTGQDQTTSNGNGVYDYLFRKYDPVAGRWLSPDPSGWAAVSQSSPQSLNRYAYVQNDPMRLTDPTGLDCVYLSDDSASIEEVDSGSCTTGDGGYWVPGTYNGLAYTDNDGSIIGFESIFGSNGYVSFFGADGTIGLGTMSWWDLPGVNSGGYNGPITTYSDSQQEAGGIALSLAGQYGGSVGTLQGIGTFYAASALGGSTLAAAWELPTVAVAVGPGDLATSPFHVAWAVDDAPAVNAVGSLGDMTVMTRYASGTFLDAYFGFNVPVLSTEGLAATGASAWTCATACINAIVQGWIP